ncbi:class I SAM-dependent methyltransferase [Natronomonas sp. EA1]|uniref:class I SAM-dependent methyltransferase n=1 Tax=Natronomonas sp. EA1 TaxID=3421655 RepID=UPI003EB705AC
MSDPFGRAIREFHRGEQDEPLRQRDGDDVIEHPIEAFYFGDYEGHPFFDDHLRGPMLDVGCGVGQHALSYQECFEAVGIEVSEHLVETARERGVTDARLGDMFSLSAQFERDRFASILCFGTQLGLGGSLGGVAEILREFAYVTDDEGTAAVHLYDPEQGDPTGLQGYRPRPEPGLAHRVFHFEYEDEVGETLVFLMLSPDRLREAAIGTGWEVEEIERMEEGSAYYAALEKQ